MVVPIRLDNSAVPSQFQISTQQPDARVLRLEPGQVLTGKVLSSNESGSTRFAWSGYSFDLKLPEQLPPGSQIQLKVMSTEGAIQLQYIRQGLQNTLISNNMPGVEVSSVSQWLSGLMEALPIDALSENDLMQSSITNQGLNAIDALRADKTNSGTDALASFLQHIVEKSGLFYEAHQAQWVQGQKTVESLFDEPQAKWSVAAGGTAPAATERNNLGIPVSLVRTIEHQLGVLEHQTIQWQGEILPGVKMSWSLYPLDNEAIEDEEYRRKAELDGEQRPWMTTFNVTLNDLGTVHAYIQIYREYVRWHLAAEKPETQALLEQSQIQWTNALQARGMHASGIVSGIYEDEDEE